MDLQSVLVVRTMTLNEVKRKSLLIITGQQNIDNLIPHVQDNKILKAYFENQVFDLKASEIKTKQNRQLQIQKTSAFFSALDMLATDQLVFWLSKSNQVHVSVLRLLYEMKNQVRVKDNNQTISLPSSEEQIYIRKIVANQEEIKAGEQFTKPHHLDFLPQDTQILEAIGITHEGKLCIIDDNNQKHLFQTRYENSKNKYQWYGTSQYMVSNKINPGDVLVLWKDFSISYFRMTLVRRSIYNMFEHVKEYLLSTKDTQIQVEDQKVNNIQEAQDANGKQQPTQDQNSLNILNTNQIKNQDTQYQDDGLGKRAQENLILEASKKAKQ